jgi:hypothetical protein
VPSLLLRDKRDFAAKGALSQRRGRRPLVAQQLILKRASASRPSGEWSEDDYDVLADGAVVGRIMKAAASPGSDVDVDARLSGIMRTARRRLRGDARGRDAGEGGIWMH